MPIGSTPPWRKKSRSSAAITASMTTWGTSSRSISIRSTEAWNRASALSALQPSATSAAHTTDDVSGGSVDGSSMRVAA